MIQSSLLDALFYAAIAAVLALTSRELRLYNLAGGAWVVLGGWLLTWVYTTLTGGQLLLRPWAFIPFMLIAVFQSASPFFLKTVLLERPLVYLFVSLGAAIFMGSFADTVLLPDSGTIIPLPDWPNAYRILVLTCAISGVVVFCILRSAWWARFIINDRLAQGGLRGSRNLSVLMALQIGLLLILGAAGFFMHRGMFGTAE